MAAQVKARYTANGGDIHPIRLSPQVYAVTSGSEPVGAVTNPIHAKQSKGKNEFGLRARGVVISRTRGTAPDTFVEYAFIPCLTAAAFGQAPYITDSTMNYKGVPWKVVALVQENVR